MNSPILELKQVSVTYSNGEIGLKLIDLKMKSGEAVLVAGATGSGKSTMAQRILNVIPHQINAQCQGEVLLEGISTVGLPPPTGWPNTCSSFCKIRKTCSSL